MLLFAFCSFLFAVTEPIMTPPKHPLPSSTSIEERQEIKKAETSDYTAEDWYEFSLNKIQEGNLASAKKGLEKALQLDPKFFQAKVQLAFVALWEKRNDEAYKDLFEVLQQEPCDVAALEGLKRLGLRWRHKQEKRKEAIKIYRTLNDCIPENPDLLFYLGALLAQDGKWQEAKKILQKCLILAPQYQDAEVQLGYIYYWEENYPEAKKLLSKYPKNPDAQYALAKIAQVQGDHKNVQEINRKILEKNPNHIRARKDLARSLASQRQFSEADDEYAELVEKEPDVESNWKEWFEVRKHSHVGAKLEATYTAAKENDPSLKAPVVKDYYFFNALHIFIPITDLWRLDLKPFFYYQKERDIYPPIGTNYRMFQEGGQILSSYLFAKNWKWDVLVRLFKAWGSKGTFYPFRQTTRFEPGTNVFYNDTRQRFVLDAHIESFLIKNFTTMRSKLLRTDYFTGLYAYRFPIKFDPEIEGKASYIFIHDNLNNRKNTERLQLRSGIPFLYPYLTFIYQFTHSHFDHLNQNYYSYKKQYRNLIGFLYQIEFYEKTLLEILYERDWKETHQLFQPIGDVVFIADRQLLIGNKIQGKLSYRFKEKMRFELGGHYFRDTLPYRDWNINGSFFWQF